MMSQFEEMVSLLDSTWHARDIIVPCLIGPVGIGKTAAVDQHARNVGAGKVVTIIVSQILPNEVSGITMPVNESKSMEIFDHARLSSLEDGDILFFDELFEGAPHVLSACLTLIESRMLMSGKKLPDIQIIAATNPTVAPAAIKPSVRQRFMFCKFKEDGMSTANYILDKTGLNVAALIPNIVCDSSTNYNFLSPRSLTKLATWMSTAKYIDDARKIAASIEKMWSEDIARVLYGEWRKANSKHDEDKVKRKVIEEAFGGDDVEHFDMTLEQIVKELVNSGQWESVAKKLADVDVDDL